MMRKVVSIDSLGLPVLRRLTNRQPPIAGTLVVSAGFEDRASAFSASLVGDSRSRAIVIEYWPKNPRNKFSEVVTHLLANGFPRKNIDKLRFPLAEPKNFSRDLFSYLNKSGAAQVTIDISGMSRLAILLTLEACRRANVDTRLYYSEAKEYHPTELRYKEARESNAILRPSLEISRGLTSVYHPPEFSTVAMHGNPRSLILFMSFNENISQTLVYQANPSRLFLVNGKPPDIRWREGATAWIHENLMREWSEDNPSSGEPKLPRRSTSTLDYRETVSTLCELYWQLSSTSRISLSPTGSKMQAVASFLVASMHRDIQIEYPIVRGYLDEYTVGWGKRWALDLGRLNDLIRAPRNIRPAADRAA